MSFKLGLIGPGGIAESRLAPAVAELEQVELWSVLSRDLARAEAFAERHGARAPRAAHDNLESMLADAALDGVLIATPDKLHGAQIVAAAGHGKHVLVEKPMVTSVEEADEAVEQCRRAGVTLAVAYHLRHHAGLRAIHERAVAGEYGRLYHLRAQWTFRASDDSNWRASEGVGRWWGLGGVGTHSLDQALWFLGAGNEVEQVGSVVSRAVHRGPHDETAVMALRFADGATAEISASVLFDAPSRFELYAERANVIGEGVLSTTGGGDITVNGERFDYTPANPYAGEIADFVEAATTGAPPAADGETGRRNIQILSEVS